MRGIIYIFLLIFLIFSTPLAVAEENITIPDPDIITAPPDTVGEGPGFDFDLIDIVAGWLSSTLFIIISMILLFIYIFQTIHPEGTKIGFFVGVIALIYIEHIPSGTVLLFAIIIMLIYLILNNLQKRKFE